MGLTTDVLLIGGGPAGLAAAMALGKKGILAIVVAFGVAAYYRVRFKWHRKRKG